MFKRFNLTRFDENLAFVWYDLMNDRSRNLALHAIARVLMGSALLIASPYAIGFFIDGLTNQSFDMLLIGGLLFLGIELCGAALSWWSQQVREYFFQSAVSYIPQAITRLYYRRPLSWLSGGTSEIDGSGVDSLREKVWNVMYSYVYQIIPGWGSISFGLIACTYANLWVGLIVMLYIIVERIIGNQENRYMQAEMRPVIDMFKRWERRMQAWWASADHIKSQGVETKITQYVHDDVQEAMRGDDAVWRVYFARRIVYQRLRSITVAASLYSLVGYLVFNERISLTVAVLAFFSFERIRSTLSDLNDQQRDVQSNLASIAKYRRVLVPAAPYLYNVGEPFNVRGDQKTITIAFDGVSHQVGEGEDSKCILRDVNLAIAAGEKVGIVGPSGAGKSQLLSLLVRAADPVEGKVLINGTDLRDWSLETLLRYYGVIMQKSEPFEDTVLGNLLFGVSHLDTDLLSVSELEQKAELALRKAGLDVGTFPSGIHTNIGYKGLKLSGGQQQRLQIAAAHMKLSMTEDSPRLIIADEPTASLDSLSELTVMQHLQDKLPHGTTMLMVAHRLSTVANMDRIVFVRPLETCDEHTPQVTAHASLSELYEAEALFREMADAQGFRP